eukprot:m.95530 g.95530  ORF g.95530 m.95530 type:complete len:402 (-) comp8604_c0_seq2:123-1328(-)
MASAEGTDTAKRSLEEESSDAGKRARTESEPAATAPAANSNGTNAASAAPKTAFSTISAWSNTPIVAPALFGSASAAEKPSGFKGFGGKAAGFGTFGGGLSFGAAKADDAKDSKTGFAAAATESKGFGGVSTEGKGFGAVAAAADGKTFAALGAPRATPAFGAGAEEKVAAFGQGASAFSATPVASGERTEHQAELAQRTVLPKVAQDTGEEDENHSCQMRAKLYVFVGGQWQERGQGQLSLNERSTENGKATSRLVMRQDLSKRLVLNAPVWSGMAPTKTDDKTIRITAINFAVAEGEHAPAQPAPQIFLIKVSAKESGMLYAELGRHVALCDKAAETRSTGGTAPASPKKAGQGAATETAEKAGEKKAADTPAADEKAPSKDAATAPDSKETQPSSAHA